MFFVLFLILEDSHPHASVHSRVKRLTAQEPCELGGEDRVCSSVPASPSFAPEQAPDSGAQPRPPAPWLPCIIPFYWEDFDIMRSHTMRKDLHDLHLCNMISLPASHDAAIITPVVSPPGQRATQTPLNVESVRRDKRKSRWRARSSGSSMWVWATYTCTHAVNVYVMW